MNTAALREQIQKAQQHEKETGLLTRQLESKLPHLHPAIQLPEADAQGVLTRFVAAYIDEVPDLLDAANEVAREAGIESQIKPVLMIAEAYFVTPPTILEGHVGLDSLLDVVTPNQTTIVDLRLSRVVREGVFRLTRSRTPRDFRKDPPGGPI